MSFTDDSRPDTRRLVVWQQVLNFGPPGVLLVIVAIYTLVPEDARDEAIWSNLTSFLYLAYFAGLIGWFVVRRAKKNADARWALAQSRTAALAAKVAELEEPAAR